MSSVKKKIDISRLLVPEKSMEGRLPLRLIFLFRRVVAGTIRFMSDSLTSQMLSQPTPG